MRHRRDREVGRTEAARGFVGVENGHNGADWGAGSGVDGCAERKRKRACSKHKERSE